MKDYLYLVGNILVRVIIVLGKISGTRIFNIIESRFKIIPIFGCVIACKFLVYPRS